MASPDRNDSSGREPAPASAGGILGRTKFVGRESELEQLAEAAERLRAGTGGFVTIRGEAGTGKTRLIEEFRTGAAPFGGVWRLGQARIDAAETPYHVFTDLLSRAWRIDEADSSDSIVEAIGSNCARLLPNEPDAPMILGRLFGMKAPELAAVEPGAWRARLYELTRLLLVSLSDEGPVVIHLEDLHWADPSSVALLRHVAVEHEPPVLVLCAYRPPFDLMEVEERGALDERFTELSLTPLSDEEADELVRSLLGAGEVPERLAATLRERAAGYPLQLEETVRALVDADVLERIGGTWVETEPVDAPLSVVDVISERVDLLGETARQVLREAAIVGRSFPYDLLHDITTAPDDLNGSLARLEELGLVQEVAEAPGRMYTFKHDLTQEVAYDDMPAAERPLLHERLAGVLEAAYAEHAADASEGLAYHYRRGLSLEKAAQYLLMSAGKAAGKFALEEAHHFYEQAYEIVSGAPQQTAESRALLVDILNSWALVFTYRGEHGAVHDLLAPHTHAAETLGDSERLAAFYFTLAAAQAGRGRPADSLEFARKGVDLAEELGAPFPMALGHNGMAWNLFELGGYERAVEHGWRSHGIAKNTSEGSAAEWIMSHLEWISLNAVALAHRYRGAVEDLDGLAALMRSEGTRQGDTRRAAIGVMAAGYARHSAGDFVGAAEAHDRALAATTDPTWVQAALLYRSIGLVDQGREREAEPTLRELWEITDGRFMQIARLVEMHLAACRAAAGDFREADSTIRAVAGALEEAECVSQLALAEYLLGKVYRQLVERAGDGDPSAIEDAGIPGIADVSDADREAESWLLRSIERAEAIGARGVSCPAYLELARLHSSMGRAPQAREWASRALEDAEDRGADGYAARAREMMA